MLRSSKVVLVNEGKRFLLINWPKGERTFWALTKLPKFMFWTFMVKVKGVSAGKVPPLVGLEILDEGMLFAGMIWPI